MARDGWDIFISSSRADAKLVADLTSQLRERGLRVFEPSRDIEVGESLAEAITTAIESSMVLVIVVSPDSLRSGWVAGETALAADQALTRGGLVVPVMLGSTGFEDLPLPLRRLQGLRVSTSKDLTRAAAQIARAVTTATQSEHPLQLRWRAPSIPANIVRTAGLRRVEKLVAGLVQNGHGLLQVVGQPGSGKTVAVASALQQFADHAGVIWIGAGDPDASSLAPLLVEKRGQDGDDAANVAVAAIRERGVLVTVLDDVDPSLAKYLVSYGAHKAGPVVTICQRPLDLPAKGYLVELSAATRSEVVDFFEERQSEVSSLTETIGPDHPATITASLTLSGDLLSLGRWAEAAELLTGLEDTAVRVLGPQHPTTLEVRSRLVTSLIQTGHVETAAGELTGLYDDLLVSLGPRDPRTTAAERSLAVLVGSAATETAVAMPVAEAVVEEGPTA